MSERFLDHDWYPEPLPENVTLGERSWLYSTYALVHFHSRMAVGLRIGDETGIYIGTMFDVGPTGSVEIGDYCTLAGPIISTNARVTLGDYVLVSSRVTIADDPWMLPPSERSVAPADRAGIAIEDDAWIGTGCTILGGAVIGAGSIVGAGSVVSGVIPPRVVAAGDPCRVLGPINSGRKP
jgi:acetyltransferase-like isoleucine patch superfamily enzyme